MAYCFVNNSFTSSWDSRNTSYVCSGVGSRRSDSRDYKEYWRKNDGGGRTVNNNFRARKSPSPSPRRSRSSPVYEKYSTSRQRDFASHKEDSDFCQREDCSERKIYSRKCRPYDDSNSRRKSKLMEERGQYSYYSQQNSNRFRKINNSSHVLNKFEASHEKNNSDDRPGGSSCHQRTNKEKFHKKEDDKKFRKRGLEEENDNYLSQKRWKLDEKPSNSYNCDAAIDNCNELQPNYHSIFKLEFRGRKSKSKLGISYLLPNYGLNSCKEEIEVLYCFDWENLLKNLTNKSTKLYRQCKLVDFNCKQISTVQCAPRFLRRKSYADSNALNYQSSRIFYNFYHPSSTVESQTVEDLNVCVQNLIHSYCTSSLADEVGRMKFEVDFLET